MINGLINGLINGFYPRGSLSSELQLREAVQILFKNFGSWEMTFNHLATGLGDASSCMKAPKILYEAKSKHSLKQLKVS